MKIIEYFSTLLMPFEIVFITLLTFIASIVLAIYLTYRITVDFISKGLENGFRRSTT